MVLDEKQKNYLRERFMENLIEPVNVNLVTSVNCRYCDMLREFLTEIAEVSNEKIIFNHAPLNPYLEKFLKVNRGPVVLIGKKGEIRYTGAPLGEETWAFIETLILASNKKHGLQKYEADLRDLDKNVRIETIITPTCPYCPQAVLLANKIAIASNGVVTSDVIEAYEFPEIAQKWGVTTVPTVVLSIEEPYSGKIFKIGAPTERELIWGVIKLGTN
jgi:glutaredoxin-like protein